MNTVRIRLICVKWYATASCTAGLVLVVNKRRVSGETVAGNAERVQVIGRKGADILLSNIFSDVVNRIDVVKLFQQDRAYLKINVSAHGKARNGAKAEHTRSM